MSKRVKDLFIGFIVGCILMVSPTVYAISTQTIQVVPNTVKVEVDGKMLYSDNFLYNGTTYLPMRTVAEAVGKEVQWEQSTMTAKILTKNINTESIKEDNTIVDGLDVREINGEIYYRALYTVKLMNEYGYYDMMPLSLTQNKITFVKKDNIILIEDIPHIMYQDRIYISKEYYENTILPLIK